MVRLVLKALAYGVAPRATLAVLHPTTAVQLKALPFELRHGLAPRVTAAAVAAVALPIGVLLGIALEQSRAERGSSRRDRVGARPRTVRRRVARETEPLEAADVGRAPAAAPLVERDMG